MSMYAYILIIKNVIVSVCHTLNSNFPALFTSAAEGGSPASFLLKFVCLLLLVQYQKCHSLSPYPWKILNSDVEVFLKRF